MTCNLLLVDDHLLIRAGVKALINDLPGYAVIGELDDGGQLLEVAERLHPDIILLDLSMRHTGGLEALPRPARQEPHRHQRQQQRDEAGPEALGRRRRRHVQTAVAEEEGVADVQALPRAGQRRSRPRRPR